jgi:hypothetical protein
MAKESEAEGRATRLCSAELVLHILYKDYSKPKIDAIFGCRFTIKSRCCKLLDNVDQALIARQLIIKLFCNPI